MEWGSPCLKSHVSEFVGTDQSRYMLGFPDMMGSTHLRCWLWGHPACRSEGALPAGPKPTHVVSIFLFQRVGPHLCPLELPSLCQPLHGSILEAEGPERLLPAAVADDRVPSPPDKGWLPLPLYTRCAAVQGSRPFLPELHALGPCPHPSMVSPSLAQTLGGRRGGSGSSVVPGKPMSFAQPSSFTGSEFSPLSTLRPLPGLNTCYGPEGMRVRCSVAAVPGQPESRSGMLLASSAPVTLMVWSQSRALLDSALSHSHMFLDHQGQTAAARRLAWWDRESHGGADCTF